MARVDELPEIAVHVGERVPLPEDPAPDALDAAPAPGDEPPAAGPSAEPAQGVDVEALAVIVGWGFEVVSWRRGPHWRVDEDEAHSIADPLAAELEPLAARFPIVGAVVDVVGGPHVQLPVAVTRVLRPRLREDRRLRREREADQDDAPQRADRSPGPPAPAPAPLAERSGFEALADTLPGRGEGDAA